MTIAEIREEIDVVLASVEFDDKELCLYASDVYKALRSALGDSRAEIDCFNRIRDFVVQIRLEGKLVEVITEL